MVGPKHGTWQYLGNVVVQEADAIASGLVVPNLVEAKDVPSLGKMTSTVPDA